MGYVRSKMRSLGMKGKKHKGPLRKVTQVLRYAETLFDVDSVVFVCGHVGSRSNGALRGRCGKCGQEKQDDK